MALTPTQLTAFEDKIQKHLGLAKFNIGFTSLGDLKLYDLIVQNRGKGTGTKAMLALCEPPPRERTPSDQ